MDKSDLPSDSDVSDEDYIPDVSDSELPSEVESDGDPEEVQDEGKRKNPSKSSKPNKKRKGDEEEDVAEAVVEKPEVTEEQRKKHEESLWADFLGATDPRPRNGGAATVGSESSSLARKENPVPPAKRTVEKVSITQVFEFAGEEVKVTKQVASDSAEARLLAAPTASSAGAAPAPVGVAPPPRARGLAGISSVLSQLGKKAKISTLEKSKLDWDSFKQDQGIQDEIETHNKGKDGYLERQDFLQRTDLRQFEIEKQLRATRRSNR